MGCRLCSEACGVVLVGAFSFSRIAVETRTLADRYYLFGTVWGSGEEPADGLAVPTPAEPTPPPPGLFSAHKVRSKTAAILSGHMRPRWASTMPPRNRAGESGGPRLGEKAQAYGRAPVQAGVAMDLDSQRWSPVITLDTPLLQLPHERWLLPLAGEYISPVLPFSGLSSRRCWLLTRHPRLSLTRLYRSSSQDGYRPTPQGRGQSMAGHCHWHVRRLWRCALWVRPAFPGCRQCANCSPIANPATAMIRAPSRASWPCPTG